MLYRPEYDENGKKILCEMNGINSDMLMDVYVKKMAKGEILEIEEEANAQELIDSLKMIKDNGFGLYMLDKELKARVYTTPAPLATSAE